MGPDEIMDCACSGGDDAFNLNEISQENELISSHIQKSTLNKARTLF